MIFFTSSFFLFFFFFANLEVQKLQYSPPRKLVVTAAGLRSELGLGRRLYAEESIRGEESPGQLCHVPLLAVAVAPLLLLLLLPVVEFVTLDHALELCRMSAIHNGDSDLPRGTVKAIGSLQE